MSKITNKGTILKLNHPCSLGERHSEDNTEYKHPFSILDIPDAISMTDTMNKLTIEEREFEKRNIQWREIMKNRLSDQDGIDTIDLNQSVKLDGKYFSSEREHILDASKDGITIQVKHPNFSEKKIQEIKDMGLEKGKFTNTDEDGAKLVMPVNGVEFINTIDIEQDIVNIRKIGEALLDLMEYKHRKYMGSALHPDGLFDVGSALTTIKVRMNDKFLRIKNSGGNPPVNDMSDLCGYDILYLTGMNENVDETVQAILAQKD